MERKWIQLASFGALMIGVAVLAVWAEGKAKEVKVTLDQVPAAVREAFTKAAGDAKITEIEQEEENGVTVYEASFVVNGKKKEIEVTADGKVIEEDEESDEEEEIAMDQVPAKARAALMTLAGDAKITKVVKETEGGTVSYEAEWTVKGLSHEAEVTEDGALISTEETMDANAVPEAVLKTAAKIFPAGAKLTFEKETEVTYEVSCTIDGKEKEVQISPDGAVDDDDDQGDDDEEDDEDDDEDDDDK
ncbi:MAG TPA: PepSY-like domain-containing protein [Phycisphaerae bacterium]|nr:PepSY-like domain-containing protein [Phycisphaerae bacterium]HRY69947.1 PepSY-like domain-containing protein [Phycisphaerae bacterium]HSA27156.1 PepSY-like domain-containing protein [Phycisphaerae bacterium]